MSRREKSNICFNTGLMGVDGYIQTVARPPKLFFSRQIKILMRRFSKFIIATRPYLATEGRGVEKRGRRVQASASTWGPGPVLGNEGESLPAETGWGALTRVGCGSVSSWPTWCPVGIVGLAGIGSPSPGLRWERGGQSLHSSK